MYLPEFCATKMPIGSLAAVTKAAKRHHLTPSAYTRAALFEALSRDGLCPETLAVVAPRIPAPSKVEAAACA